MESPCLSKEEKEGNQQKQKKTKRGDIWPASIRDIAMPPEGTKSSQIEDASDVLKEYIRNYRTRMLKSPLEIRELRKLHSKEMVRPYVDPNIQSEMKAVAIRMAKNGMLRGITRIESTIGMFTVVKKVEDGRIILRLILDQRVPNLYWQEPPWVGMAGPGAFASLDLSEEGD